jgi:pSer/pThr/pTyr-binding forkhead associated (FHA) protein
MRQTGLTMPARNEEDSVETDLQRARKVIPTPALRFDRGPAAGLTLQLDREVATLGRHHENSYVVGDPGVSRVHAEVRKRGSSVFLTDLGSSSGTRVNGEPIDGASMLHHGDEVSFGRSTAFFEDPAVAAEVDDPTMVFDVPSVPTAAHLSPRQQQVVELLAEGMTNTEIGAQLGITERTVKAYAQELYDKLGVRHPPRGGWGGGGPREVGAAR